MCCCLLMLMSLCEVNSTYSKYMCKTLSCYHTIRLIVQQATDRWPCNRAANTVGVPFYQQKHFTSRTCMYALNALIVDINGFFRNNQFYEHVIIILTQASISKY